MSVPKVLPNVSPDAQSYGFLRYAAARSEFIAASG